MSTKVHMVTPMMRKPISPVEHPSTGTKSANSIKNSVEPYCHVKLDSINKLKDSTRKLLCLLDNIQSKTYSKVLLNANNTNEVELDMATVECARKPSFLCGETEPALRHLEAQTQELNNIYIEDEDDCSIFKRLTRKCICLNQQEYNDFMIHFNEDTKYFTSTSGEIIKNLRILKKFLYMGGTYTKNALIFLNEGLEKSTYTEKVEITHGCSHSDLCNVFEDHSIVILCISWPCKFSYYGDSVTQNLAASFLYKLAQVEEGRRYLKYTTKITNDIKKVMRKNESRLEIETKETLEATLNLIHPSLTQNTIIYSPQNDEGFVAEILTALQHFRQYMTLGEVFINLQSLANYSFKGKTKIDLTFQLPRLLRLFKKMLKEYDNSEMNILITSILNNIVLRNNLKQRELDEPKTIKLVETATEPVKMKNEIIQMPQKHTVTKKFPNKSKLNLKSANLNRSRKFGKNYGLDVIVVPFEKK